MNTTVSTVRDTVVSVTGAFFLTIALVGAAVVPAQGAVAAMLGL